MTELTHEQAIKHYAELQRVISVGAYAELQHDGSYPPDDGSVESHVLQSVDNLEIWAQNEGLQFSYDSTGKRWELVEIPWEPEDMESRLARQEQRHIEDRQYYSQLGLHEEQP